MYLQKKQSYKFMFLHINNFKFNDSVCQNAFSNFQIIISR